LGTIVDAKAKNKKRTQPQKNIQIKSELDKVLEKNRKQFEHFSNLIQIADAKTIEAATLQQEEDQQKVQIGALTNFDALQEEEDEATQKKDVKAELGETEGLTVEQLEQKRLEEFRANKKDEMEALTNQMNSLKDKLAKIKKEALTTQTDVEEKRKTLDVE